MANFDIAFKRTMEFEGGYSNDPDDNGGETKYGISEKSYPKLSIRELTLNEVKHIYVDSYWNGIRGDEIENQELANVLFDTAVNIGLKEAIIMVQKIIGTTVDGIVGSITLNWLNTLEPECLIERYKLARIRYYYDISNKRNRKFFFGWVRRTLLI